MKTRLPTDDQLKHFLITQFFEYQMKQEMEELNKGSNEQIEKFKSRLQKVTPRLFARYLEAKGVSKNCTLCGEDALSVPEGGVIDGKALPKNYHQMTTDEQRAFFNSGMVTYVSYMQLGGESLADLRHKTYYPMHCLNCGNLNLIRVSKVLDWIEKETKEEQENEC